MPHSRMPRMRLQRRQDINRHTLTTDDFIHWTPVSIRFSDQDSMGHVNNVAYAAYFEAGRIDFTSTLLGETPDGSRQRMVIASLNVDYVAEMHYPGTVQIGSRIERIGNRSFCVKSAAFKNNVLHASAEATLVCSGPMQDWVRERLAQSMARTS